MPDEVDDLKKLTPEERIKKLKELEKKRKDEIERAQKLIKQSEEELEDDENQKRDIPVPQLKSIDIESLFTDEEKKLFATKRFIEPKSKIDTGDAKEEKREKRLEEEIRETPAARHAVMEAEKQYLLKLSELPQRDLYREVKDIYKDVTQQGELTAEQKDKIYNIRDAMQIKRDAVQEGEYNLTEAVARQMDITYGMIKKMKDRYKGMGD